MKSFNQAIANLRRSCFIVEHNQAEIVESTTLWVSRNLIQLLLFEALFSIVIHHKLCCSCMTDVGFLHVVKRKQKQCEEKCTRSHDVEP